MKYVDSQVVVVWPDGENGWEWMDKVQFLQFLEYYFFPFLHWRFTLVKERLIEFNQLAMANHDGSEDMLNRVMTKDNIGLAALLETKEAAWENCGQ